MKLPRTCPLKTLLIALLTVAALTVAACGGGETPTATPASPTPSPTLTPTPAEESMPPVTSSPDEINSESTQNTESGQAESPLAVPDSPLSAPVSPLATPVSAAHTPATSTEDGGLTGQIVVNRPSGEVAVSGLIIGLAEVILGDDGLPKASGYEASAAPKAITDDLGRFVFANLEPAVYTLILDAVVTQYQLDDAETGDTILIEVKPNEAVDLGVLRYPSLPIPGFQ